jgi:S1-C subfamily serine protease
MESNGPAGNAGLKALQEMPKQMLAGLVVAGSMMFPPAIILVPVLTLLPIGPEGDLIIAVDGSRVKSVLDFENRIHNVQPGEIVYLTIVRRCARIQVSVRIPDLEGSSTTIVEQPKNS